MLMHSSTRLTPIALCTQGSDVLSEFWKICIFFGWSAHHVWGISTACTGWIFIVSGWEDPSYIANLEINNELMKQNKLQNQVANLHDL